MVRILVGDDHVLIREGLKTLLRREKSMKIIGEAKNSTEVFQQLRRKTFDLVILDISLPGKDGLEILKDVKKQFPKVPVLMLTIHPEERFAVRALKAGASGYVTKESASREMVKAIKRVVSGNKYVSSHLAEKLASELLAKREKPPHEDLSDREFQIMCLIASGKNVKEIGKELSLSVGTVYSYRERILVKMKMKTNVELSHYAMGNRLID